MLRTSLLAVLLMLPTFAAAQTDPHSRDAAVQAVRPIDPVKADPPTMPGAGHPTGSVSIGDVAPGFMLEDQDGRNFKLASQRGSWVAMCFGDRRTVLALADSAKRALAGLDLLVVGVVHENGQALRAHCAKHALHVRALADHSGEVSMVYGLWDSEHACVLTSLVIVDPQGIIRAREVDANLSRNTCVAAVRSALSGL